MVFESILDFLRFEQPFDFNGEKRHSSLVLGLHECRKATGRNIKTGLLDGSEQCGNIGNWLGALGYFSILDLIGSTFKNSDETNKPSDMNSIEFAIKSFGDGFIAKTNQDEIDAVVALRHAFAHNFNLLNQKPYKLSLQHKFSVYAENNNEIVKLRKIQWDGDIHNKNFSETADRTYVNIFGVGNMTEEIYQRLILGIKSASIGMQVDTQIALNKYTFIVTNEDLPTDITE